MSKGSKKDRLARVKELYDFDESLLIRRHGDTEIPKSGHGDTETRGLRHGNTETQGHGELHFPRVSPSPRLLLAGFDEAGRGALAGPVVVGCVHFSLLALGSVPPVASESCPHFRQAASDVPFTQGATSLSDPSVVLELASDVVPNTSNHSQDQSSNHSMTQSLNDSIPPSPRVSSSPRPAFLEDLAGLDDSKRLTARQREALCPRIKSHAAWGIGIASAEEIDELGIVPAVSLAARRAYRAMVVNVDLLLCDRGITVLCDSAIERLNHLTRQASYSSVVQFPNLPVTQSPNDSIPRSLNFSITQSSDHSIIQSPNLSISQSPDHSITQSTELSFTRGDSRSLHIAAASIIAKVTRDQMMVDLDSKFPGYGFAKNKAYGTAVHLAALRRLGPSAVHRKSFHVKG